MSSLNGLRSLEVLRQSLRDGDYLDVNGENIQFNRLQSRFSRNTIIADNTLVDGTERIVGQGVPVAGNELSFVASARIISVASTNANDTSAGTGLRTILLIGCGVDGNEQTETIIMNGQTEVDSVNQYSQVNEMFGLTSGTNETNLGIIYASDDTDTFTAGVPQNRVYDIMDIGHSLSKVGLFTVPLNKTMLIKRIVINTDATEAKPMKVNVYRTFNDRNVMLLVGTFYLAGIFLSNLELDRTIAPGDSVRITAENLGAGTIQVSIKLQTIFSTT